MITRSWKEYILTSFWISVVWIYQPHCLHWRCLHVGTRAVDTVNCWEEMVIAVLEQAEEMRFKEITLVKCREIKNLHLQWNKTPHNKYASRKHMATMRGHTLLQHRYRNSRLTVMATTDLYKVRHSACWQRHNSARSFLSNEYSGWSSFLLDCFPIYVLIIAEPKGWLLQYA